VTFFRIPWDEPVEGPYRGRGLSARCDKCIAGKGDAGGDGVRQGERSFTPRQGLKQKPSRPSPGQQGTNQGGFKRRRRSMRIIEDSASLGLRANTVKKGVLVFGGVETPRKGEQKVSRPSLRGEGLYPKRGHEYDPPNGRGRSRG